MWKRFLLAAALTVSWAALPATAGELTIGDPAPKLQVKEFVKGDPVATLEKGKTYVVEFWATWCPPCRTTIPHLTELQKKHKDITFLGVSVYERNPDAVKPFVDKMGDKMDYRVAMDSIPEGARANEGKMAKTWMEAAALDGIPAAFIINADGKIAWIGHPMQMETPLEKIATGHWDLEVAIKEHKEAAARSKKLNALRTKLIKARQANDSQELLAVIDEALKDEPKFEPMLAPLKFPALVRLDDGDKALEYGNHLVDKVFKEDRQGLNLVAWTIVDPDAKKKPDAKLLKLALKAAQQADALAKSKDAAISDTLAKAYFDNGDAAKALEVQERALNLAKGTPLEKDKGMKERLEQYQKAVMK